MDYEVRNKKSNYILRYKVFSGLQGSTVTTDKFGRPISSITPSFGSNLSTLQTELYEWVSVPLYIVSNIEPGYERSIIIRESATGDKGFVIDNGKLQTSITVNGELLSKNNESLMSYEEQIRKLQGQVVELIPKKFKPKGVPNKFFIQSFRPQYSNVSDVSIPFTMVLQEYREVGLESGTQKLLDNQLLEIFKQITAFDEIKVGAGTPKSKTQTPNIITQIIDVGIGDNNLLQTHYVVINDDSVKAKSSNKFWKLFSLTPTTSTSEINGI